MCTDTTEPTRQYERVACAIGFIREHARDQPSLEAIAAAVHLSPYHLQRLFGEWAGLSPKRFLQYLTKEYARQQLQAAEDVLSVSVGAGLSSTSRLHDLMVSCEAMTPGEIRSGGEGLAIGYGYAGSPFGEAIIAWTQRGICHLAFVAGGRSAMGAELVAAWPRATVTRDDGQADALLRQVFAETPSPGRLHLVLRGTNFQIKVWEALMQVGCGQVLSYRQLAGQAGCPGAQRAVGSALAANSIAWLIPCHRVIRGSGEVGDYRWGSERKQAMLAWEAGRVNRSPPRN